jgi:hypothetical protein
VHFFTIPVEECLGFFAEGGFLLFVTKSAILYWFMTSRMVVSIADRNCCECLICEAPRQPDFFNKSLGETAVTNTVKWPDEKNTASARVQLGATHGA